MDFNELKRQYKKDVENMMREIDELNNKMESSDYKKEIVDLLSFYKKALESIKQGGLKDLKRILDECNYKDMGEVEEKYKRVEANYKRDISKKVELEERIKREYIICPTCQGVGYQIYHEYVVTDIGRMPIVHFEECKICNNKGKIATKDLLDC
jgi:thermostable 8-oxoguanine DNA glycosylase